MARKMIVVNAALEEKHRAQIRAAAERWQFDVAFFSNEAEALPQLADAEIVFGQSADLAKNSPSLRWLCTPSAGVNQFLGEGIFAAPGALLTNSSGAYGVTIAEHIIMVTLEMLRRQQDYNTLVAERVWQRDLPIRSIRDSRVTLMGTGDIGQETAIRLRAFGPACIRGVNRGGGNPKQLFDSVCTRDQMESLLSDTHLLILCLPETVETRHILSAERLALLPDGALIVNVGRGTAIDQQALEKELRSGRLYAALDVFEQEPLPAEDALWDCPHLLLTPHVAGNMTLPYTKDRIVAMFLEDFENYCAGRPLRHRVDLKKGY